MFSTVIIAAAVAQASSPAAIVSSHQPQTIVQFLQDRGYQAKLGTDKLGDPMIESATGGTRFTIYFYGCESGRNCSDLAFQTGYNFDSGKEPALDVINKYNKGFRFARATIDDEKDPLIQMDVIFTDGQMSGKMFEEHLDLWASCLGDFEKAIGW